MPLPLPSAPRTLVHSRRVHFESFQRADGLWDIEAHLVDVKSHDYPLASGIRPGGVPVHDMRVRLTIDAEFNVVDAAAVADGVPYPGFCDAVAPAYECLIGLNLRHGFRKAVRDRLGGIHGCSHLTELLGHFPTVAIQTRAGEKRDNEERQQKPFQLDHCHALDTHGEAVRRYYPKWYRGAKARGEPVES